MSHPHLQIPETLRDYLPAQYAASADQPWIPPATSGKSATLRHVFADDRGFVERLRMQPGVSMPLHRHTGEIHAGNLEGSRRLCTGEIVGPGDYVYEPSGDVDGWTIAGEAPMTAFVIVMGDVEFLDADGAVCARASAQTQIEDYRRYCVAQGLTPREGFAA